MKERADSGFILVAVLWFAALLALAAVVIEGWVSSALDRGAALDARVAAQAAFVSAEQRVAFLLAAGTASPRGIELRPPSARAAPEENAPSDVAEAAFSGPFVALDNRPYRIGGTVVRLQDGGGLYDINNPDRRVLGRLLQSFGLADRDRERLIRSLLDYESRPEDTNAGAADDEPQDRLPLPRHAKLLTPWELLRVPGWPGAEALWRLSSPLPEMLTIGPIGGLNVNTASRRMLTAAGGLDEREAASLVAARAVRPLTSLRDLGPAAAGSDEDRPLDVAPSGVIRLQLTRPDEPLQRTLELRVTPSGKAPIRTDYVVDLPSEAGAAGLRDAPPLPQPPAGANPAAPP